MKTQMVKMFCNGEYKVIRDSDAKANPYKIYFLGWDCLKNKRRQKKLTEFGNFSSAMYYLANVVYNKDQE